MYLKISVNYYYMMTPTVPPPHAAEDWWCHGGFRSNRDVLDFPSEGPDGIDHRIHCVAPVRIEENNWDDVLRCCLDMRLEDTLHPKKHDMLVHQCILLHLIVHVSGVGQEILFLDPGVLCALEDDDGSKHDVTQRGDDHGNSGVFCIACQFLNMNCFGTNQLE